MPFLERTATPNRVQESPIQNVQLPGGVAPILREPTDAGLGATSSFWASLSKAAGATGAAYVQQSQEEAYLQGKEDNLAKRGMQSQNWINQGPYEHGFNQVTLAAEGAKLQASLKALAEQSALAGDDMATFEGKRDKLIASAMDKAEQVNLSINEADHKAWLDSLDNARTTNTMLFDQVSGEYRKGLRLQAHAAESNASISQLSTAFQTGNLEDAKRILDTGLNRLVDNSLNMQEQDGIAASYLEGVLKNAQTHQEVKFLGEYMVQTNRFKVLPTNMQTRLVELADATYKERAQMQSQKFYEADFQVSTASNIDTLPKMEVYFQGLDSAIAEGTLSVAQAYQMKDNYWKQYLTFKNGAAFDTLLGSAPLTAIAANKGWTLDKTTTETVKSYTSRYGYGPGAARLVLDGFALKDPERSDAGIDLITRTVSKIQTTPYDQIQWKDGKPVVNSDVNAGISFLYATYHQYKNSNPQFAEHLLEKVPEAVRRGIRDTSNEGDMLTNILQIQKSITEHRVESHPVDPPKELFFDREYAKEHALQFWGAGKDIGVKTGFWESDADAQLINGRLSSLNNAVAAEYSRMVRDNKQSAAVSDTITRARNTVIQNSVLVDNGTDAGVLMVLPTVDDTTREKIFGSKHKDVIQEALATPMGYYKKVYPRAESMFLEYVPFEDSVQLRMYDTEGVELKTNVMLHPAQLRQYVNEHLQLKQNQFANVPKNVPIVVPGQGIIPYNAQNKYNVDFNVMGAAVQHLINMEGYTEEKGFSILAKHPKTGSPLHSPEYVKQPGENAGVALQKLNKYINDAVMPKVMPVMEGYKTLPVTLQNDIFKALVETTYHAGNAEAFNSMIQQALSGYPMSALVMTYAASALGQDAAKERDGVRLRLLETLSNYHKTAAPAGRFMGLTQQ